MEGDVEGRAVKLDGITFVTSRLHPGSTSSLQGLRVAGAVVVAVAIDGKTGGEIVLADALRTGTQSLLLRVCPERSCWIA